MKFELGILVFHTVLQYNPRHVYFKVSPTLFSGAYSQVSVGRILALTVHTCSQ